MTIEAVNQFLTKVSQDEKLQTELSQAMGATKDRTAAVKLAAQHGYKFTTQELGQQIDQVKAANELSEKELEAVAGGKDGARTGGGIIALGSVVSSAVSSIFG